MNSSGMDEAAIEQAGLAPLKPEFDRIAAIVRIRSSRLVAGPPGLIERMTQATESLSYTQQSRHTDTWRVGSLDDAGTVDPASLDRAIAGRTGYIEAHAQVVDRQVTALIAAQHGRVDVRTLGRPPGCLPG